MLSGTMQLGLKIILILLGIIQINGETCSERVFEEESFVCVCSEQEPCGFVGQVSDPEAGSYLLMSSSKDNMRFQMSTGLLTSNDSTAESVQVVINAKDLRQTMIGFGGAFTDSTGIAINSLPVDVQQMLLRSYFSPEGIEYNVARIPMAGTDFSTHPYSYDDIAGDTNLTHFSLTKEDQLYKIPHIRSAMAMSNRNLLFFGSPWSPPSWMKENGQFNGTGGLLPEMRQTWADYFVRFLDSYSQEGIQLWGLTAQNEPTMGQVTAHPWNACAFTAEEQRDFVADYLGPTLNSSGYLDGIHLMVADDSREVFPGYPTTVLSDPRVNEYVSGIAVHWYADRFVPPVVLNTVHERFPDKFMMYTEACEGFLLGEEVRLGSWNRGEEYARNIIENVNHWSSGWTDWNMALDQTGGPNWASNYVDSPIIVNADAGEFYKQPMYYAMGHFSKFVPEMSKAIGVEIHATSGARVGIDATAFITPTGKVVVVLVNSDDMSTTVKVSNAEGDSSFVLDLPARSIHTTLY